MKISFGQNDLEPSSKLKSGLLVTTLLINLVTIPAALPQELSRASVDWAPVDLVRKCQRRPHSGGVVLDSNDSYYLASFVSILMP